MNHKKRLMVVTDLDGSLLDDGYSWSAALPALELIKQRGIPLVLNSSKTMAEMSELANELDTMAPIIAENGGLVAVHEDSGFIESQAVLARRNGYLININGLSRDFILEQAHALRAKEGYDFEGFADWTDAQVSAHTGLPESMAHRSRSRHATEPILWNDTSERRELFEAALAQHGIRILRGGRFLHLMGQADKADGSRAAIELYNKLEPGIEWTVVAVGDSANDLAMLEAADIAVVIPHADGPHVEPEAARVVHASSPSTVGWNEALLSILNETN